MISTVTTSTISTASFVLIGIITLFLLLLQKEVTSTSKDGRMRKLGQILNIGIVPLLIAFLLVVAAKVIDIFR